MTEFVDYTVPQNFENTIKRQYVRNWILSQIKSGIQPSASQVLEKYSETIPDKYYTSYKRKSYEKYISVIEEKYYDFFTFKCISDGGTVSLYNANENNPVLDYNINQTGWHQNWDYTPIELNKNDFIQFRGNNALGFCKSESIYSTFVLDGTFVSMGNIMSLLDVNKSITDIPADYCFFNLFNNCTQLKSPPNLPALVLKNSCYKYMFRGCQYLHTAPKLPATVMKDSCYCGMFFNCYSLKTMPELNATSLEKSCYSNMFSGCYNLENVIELLPATTLYESCYFSMFTSCSKITTAPKLPAPTLVKSCYSMMFRDCSKLKNVKCLALDIQAKQCTYDWLLNVYETGTFTKASTMKQWTIGSSGIPNSDWEVIDE